MRTCLCDLSIAADVYPRRKCEYTPNLDRHRLQKLQSNWLKIGKQHPNQLNRLPSAQKNDAASASSSQADAISAQQPHAKGIGGKQLSWLRSSGRERKKVAKTTATSQNAEI
jgi:hypothetical protein